MKSKLGDMLSIRTGKLDANASSPNGKYPFFTCSKEPLKIDTYSYDCECVLVAGNGDLNVKYYNGKFDAYQRTYILEKKNDDLYMPYLYYFMEKYIDTLRSQSIGGVIKYIKLENITDAKIELLPKDEQVRICKILDKVKSSINSQKHQLQKLDTLIKARFVEMFANKGFNKTQIGNLVDCNITSVKVKLKEEDIINYIDISSIDNNLNIIKKPTTYILKDAPSRAQQVLKTNDILVSTVRPNLKNIAIVDINMDNLIGSSGFCILRPQKCTREYLFYCVLDDDFTKKMVDLASGASYPAIHDDDILNYKVTDAPIKLQSEFSNFVHHIDKLKFA